MREGRCRNRGNFPRTRLSGSWLSQPDTRRSIDKRRNGLLPVGLTKVVGCCPGGRFLTVKRCCAVAPVDMLAVEVANLQTGNAEMAVGVSHGGGGL